MKSSEFKRTQSLNHDYEPSPLERFTESPSVAIQQHQHSQVTTNASPSIGSNPVSEVNQMRQTVQGDFGAARTTDSAFGVDLQPTGIGQELEPAVRTQMENAFQMDFSEVSVHNDGQPERIGATAFATGNQVHFAEGQYDPFSQSGQELIGHELSHIVQQRDNRVHAPSTDGNATVFQDPGLEAEADASGRSAATGQQIGRDRSSSNQAVDTQAVQQKPVAQAVLPVIGPAAASLMAWAAEAGTVASISTLATIASTAGGAASAVGAMVAPGSTGVQEVQIENGWMSNVDKQQLEFIIQAKLINAYVDAWVRAHPGVDLRGNTTEPQSSTTSTTTTTPTPPAAAPSATAPAAPSAATPAAPTGTTSTTSATTTRDASATASGGGVDTALGNIVKAQVQVEIERELNRNQQTASDREFIWSDSGDSTADMIGTVGAIKFSEVKGTHLTYGVNLNANAAQIPGLALPMQGTSITIKQFRGGRMHRGPSMETGYGDNLSINLMGNGPTIDQAEPSMTYATSWNWDGNTTSMSVKISLGATGAPSVIEVSRDGTPDDNSWF